MKHLIPVIIVVSLIAFSNASLAVSTPTAPVSDMAATDAIRKQTETKTFLGTVEKLRVGAALFTDGAIYPLLGGDFEQIIGKQVRITGQLIKEDNIEKIVVARIQIKR